MDAAGLVLMMGLLIGAATVNGARRPHYNVLCNVNNYEFGSLDYYNVQWTVNDLQQGTPQASGRDYRTDHGMFFYHYWGHATCSTKIREDKCKRCLTTAAKKIKENCPWSVGAQANSINNLCTLRYEKYQI